MNKTKIEWTEHVWNPVRSCTRVSPGCVNCYAERMAARGLPGMNSPTTGEPFAIMKPSGPRWTGKVELIKSMLDIPLRRKKPTTFFVNSMSDLFHEALPRVAKVKIFQIMQEANWHEYQILTKRAAEMVEFIWSLNVRNLPNIRLGVSVEDQQRADERIPELMKLAAMGWKTMVSAEPLLGPIRIPDGPCGYYCDEDVGHVDHQRVGWVIVGGESGPGARPMHPDWARSIRDQCVAAGVPFFFKQWGEWAEVPHEDYPGSPQMIEEGDVIVAANGQREIVGKDLSLRELEGAGVAMRRVGKKAAGRLLDGREWNEMPVAQE